MLSHSSSVVAPDVFTLQHRCLQWVSFSLRYYGCGLVVPESLEGCRILDLGSGSGRDCYMLSQLVGEKGHVTGIDMTEDQVRYITQYQYGCSELSMVYKGK